MLLAAVNHLDHAIGEVIKALDETKQRENTLILFSSDNGPQGSWSGNAYPDDLKLTNFNQPLPMRGMKCDVWEGGIHVPGIFHFHEASRVFLSAFVQRYLEISNAKDCRSSNQTPC